MNAPNGSHRRRNLPTAAEPGRVNTPPPPGGKRVGHVTAPPPPGGKLGERPACAVVGTHGESPAMAILRFVSCAPRGEGCMNAIELEHLHVQLWRALDETSEAAFEADLAIGSGADQQLQNDASDLRRAIAVVARMQQRATDD